MILCPTACEVIVDSTIIPREDKKIQIFKTDFKDDAI